MDKEKLRQIWRPKQVKVIFINLCALLSHLSMIPIYFPGRKKKNKTKDPLKYFSCLQRKPSILGLAKRML